MAVGAVVHLHLVKNVFAVTGDTVLLVDRRRFLIRHVPVAGSAFELSQFDMWGMGKIDAGRLFRIDKPINFFPLFQEHPTLHEKLLFGFALPLQLGMAVKTRFELRNSLVAPVIPETMAFFAGKAGRSVFTMGDMAESKGLGFR